MKSKQTIITALVILGLSFFLVSQAEPPPLLDDDRGPNYYWLSVGTAGLGGGTVNSSPSSVTAGVTCSSGSAAGCSAYYLPGASVSMTVSPDSNSVFSGWSGACAGSSLSCSIVMDGNKTVTASFAPKPAVTPPSEPASAGVIVFTCNEAVCSTADRIEIRNTGDQGSVLAWTVGKGSNSGFSQEMLSRLVLTPQSGATWVGSTASVAVTMNDQAGYIRYLKANKKTSELAGLQVCDKLSPQTCRDIKVEMTAEFAPPPKLTVIPSGNPAGRVNSSPAGISACRVLNFFGVNLGSAGVCQFSFENGTNVILSPSGAEAEWRQGDCDAVQINEENDCGLRLTSDRTVRVNFKYPPPPPPTPEVKAPVLTCADGSAACNSDGQGRVTLKLVNPVDYQRVTIRRSPINDPGVDKENRYSYFTEAPSSKGTHSITVSGLEPDSTYGFYAKAVPKTQ